MPQTKPIVPPLPPGDKGLSTSKVKSSAFMTGIGSNVSCFMVPLEIGIEEGCRESAREERKG